MRHYEIVFLIHPDQSDQVPAMIDRYRNVISSHKGQVHRFENWGRRQLAYPINKIHKAHFVLMNIECDQQTLKELESTFHFNDAILRHLFIKCDRAITEPSPLAKGGEKHFSTKSPKPPKRTEASKKKQENVTPEESDITEITEEAIAVENAGMQTEEESSMVEEVTIAKEKEEK